MIFQTFMFVSIRFGSEWIFTILFMTSKIYFGKQLTSIQQQLLFERNQISEENALFFYKKQIPINKNKFKLLQCKGFIMHSRQDI